MKDIFQIFFSKNSKMDKIRMIIDGIAGTDISILIKGEKGVGKGLVAESIHLNSNRRPKPFVKVNCSALPKELLETELFGCERGIPGGAHLKRPGKFELANGGTILLNEIGEIEISLQAKLLRVLQEGGFYRMGGEGDIHVNTRVITATEDHLEKRVKERRFREDLFFHINAMSITVPPLRDRGEQIVPLAEYFFDFYKTKYDRSISSLSLGTMAAFKEYDWPGNVRELENTVKRIVIFREGEEVLQEMMQKRPGDGLRRRESEHESPLASKHTGFLSLKEVGRRAAGEAESEMIWNILQETRWNRREAARLLHISYKALLYKIQKYGLNGSKGFNQNQVEGWQNGRG